MDSERKKELIRKSIHISSLLLPFSYRYLFHYHQKNAFLIVGSLTVLALVVEIIRLEHRTFKRIFYNMFGIMLRKHEIHDFTGATYLMVSATLCIAVFPEDIAFLSLCFLSIGDTLAAIIGISFGKRKLFGTSKSLEGSLACFVSTFIFALFFIDPTIAFFGAMAATLAEFSRLPIDDNIKIPITSGLVMSLVNILV